jgi:dsDNA-specific endonuclease/ATPase MutS2
MQLKIGDKVAVIDSTIEGTVKFIRENLVDIEDTDGFLRTYRTNELVNITRELNISDVPFPQNKTSKHPHRLSRSKEIIIDLHYKGTAANFPILEEQIKTFYRELNKALKTGKNKLIVIHGIGEGKLKQRLIKELNQQQIAFYEAPYHLYGYGALEINLSALSNKHYRYTN